MAEEFNVSQHVVDELKPLLPATWKWVPYQTNLDAIAQTTVMLILDEVTRFPQAPQGSRLVSYVVEVIEPKIDPVSRDFSLFESLIDLLNGIDSIADLTWTSAKRGAVNNGANLGYDIEMTIRIDKD